MTLTVRVLDAVVGLVLGYWLAEFTYRIVTRWRQRKNAREIKAEMQLDHARTDRIIALRKLQRQDAEREQNPFLRDVYARKD